VRNLLLIEKSQIEFAPNGSGTPDTNISVFIKVLDFCMDNNPTPPVLEISRIIYLLDNISLLDYQEKFLQIITMYCVLLFGKKFHIL